MVRTPLFAVPLASVLLTACAALEPGRSMGRQLDDFNASLGVKSAMLRSEGYALDQVDVEITEGVMLLSGSAPRDADRIFAECLAWSAPGVRSVVNEIEVGAWRGTRELAQDSVITQQVRARLVQDPDVRALNFNIETRQSVVYLLGYARDRAEADHAAQHAARVPGVERVVDLVRVTGETPELPARGALQAEACDAVGGAPLQPGAPVLDQPIPAPSSSPQLLGEPDASAARSDPAPAASPAQRVFEPRLDRTQPSEPARRPSSDAMPF
ncbi:BON domain-containing protein [Maricaulaceae bacterium MS644]